MTVRDYVISQIQEVADAWAERVHSNPNRTEGDEDDLLRVAGMNMAVNIICGIDLAELEAEVENDDVN